MKKNFIISIIALLLFVACNDQTVVEKPKNLIKESQMIDMLVDVHLAESTFTSRHRQDSTIMNTTQTDFYYSILDKYSVADSVFEQSYVYYLSNPKHFEKMYRKVQSKISEIEQEYSGRKKELLEFEEDEKAKK